jgi:PAS domain-containing protein
MNNLESLADALTHAEPATLAKLLAASSDVALVIGDGNVISSIAAPSELSSRLDIDRWLGRPFDRIVTPDSRADADLLLRRARTGGGAVQQAIAHGADDGARIELCYSAAALGSDRPLVLVGRTITNSRESVSADPFRQVFEVGAQPSVVVDGRTGRVLEASPQLAVRLGIAQSQLHGMDVFDLVAPPWRREARARLRGVMASGRPDRFVAEAGQNADSYVVAVDRHEGVDAGTILVRFLPPQTGAPDAPPASSLVELVDGISEAVSLLESDGRILWTNEAFLGATGLADPGLAIGRQLDDFLQLAGGTEFSELLTKAREEQEPVSCEVTVPGMDEEVRHWQLSLAWLGNAQPQGFGAVLTKTDPEPRKRDVATADASAILGLVGSVPLKELVRDTTDTVEKMCIEAALRLTGDNRAAAARALGLSRQALYLKLERYGLGGN